MLEVVDLCVFRNKKLIVDDISFSLKSGDWLMIVGPNGGGKSTLVQGINGSLKTKGKVLCDGEELHKMKPQMRAKKVGILRQTNQLSYDLTVEEVVSLGRYASSKGFVKNKSLEDVELINFAMKKCGVDELKNRSCLMLSGGERQRVFLAQVFAQNPEILILDEPTNNLDLKYQKEIFELVKQWLSEGNRSVISIVHDLNLAKFYGNKAMILNKGKIIAQGDVVKTINPEVLNPIYEIDVKEWMQKLLDLWN